MRKTTAIALLLLGLGPALADGAQQTAVEKEKQTLEEYAAANKACHEWTDGCLVCLRHDDGSFACSLPGIACEPTGLTCRTAQDAGAPPAPAPTTQAPPAPANQAPPAPATQAPAPKAPAAKATGAPDTPVK